MRRIFELAAKITSYYNDGSDPTSLQTVSFVGNCFLCARPSAGNTRLIADVALHEGCYDCFQQDVRSVRDSIFEHNRERILVMMAAGLLVRDVRGIIARYMLHMDPSEPYMLMALVKFPVPHKSMGPDLISLFCEAAVDRLIKG